MTVREALDDLMFWGALLGLVMLAIPLALLTARNRVVPPDED
jgi:hypothetical protein